jgi:hypothetical protein
MQNHIKPEIQAAFEALQANCHNLILATVDSKSMPEASTMPFLRDAAGHFYIFVSQLARHTQNLKDNPRASVMLVEDEADCRQYFARQRIQYTATVETVPNEEKEYRLSGFRERFGHIIELLSSLPDFEMYRLVPVSGQFVMGFGQAYELGGEGLDRLSLIGPN